MRGRRDRAPGVKVGITGGAGYLGSALALRMAAAHEVSVIDVQRPAWADSARIQFVSGDVTDAAQMRGAFDGLDVVFHRAGLAGNLPSMRDPERYFDVNTMGTINVLEACEAGGVKRFLFDSTEFVYGIEAASPVTEAQPARPCSIYGATKRICELLVASFDRAFVNGAMVLRFCRVRHDRKRDVVSAFSERILDGQPICIAAGGGIALDFVDLEDATSAAIAAALSPVRGEIVNIGPGQGLSLNEIVGLIETISGRKADVVFEGASAAGAPAMQEFEFGPAKFWLDSGKARRTIDWSARTGIAESIRQTVEALRRNRPEKA